MQYSAQGSYHIEQQDNILMVDAQGPFNDVTAEKYHQDITKVTEKMSQTPWGSLITFRGNSIFTPEAEEQLKETTLYRQERGMVAIAVVILNSAYADMQQMQLQRIYQDCQIVFHVFSDIDIAKAWLDDFINESLLMKKKSKKNTNLN